VDRLGTVLGDEVSAGGETGERRDQKVERRAMVLVLRRAVLFGQGVRKYPFESSISQ